MAPQMVTWEEPKWKGAAELTRPDGTGFGMELPLHRWSHRINRQYVLPSTSNEEFARHRAEVFGAYMFVLLKSLMGSGKTIAVKKHLRLLLQENPHLRILIINPRISLTRTLLQTMNTPDDEGPGLNFVSYRNRLAKQSAEWLQQQDRLIICINSVARLLRGSMRGWDVIVMDECETVLFQFGSVHMRDKDNQFDTLQWIARSVQHQLILMDADAGQRSYMWLEGIASSCSASVHSVVNECTTQPNRYTIIDNFASWLQLLLYRLAKGDCVVVPINRKKKAEHVAAIIEKELPHLKGKILLYTSKSDAAIKRGVKHCNTEWLKYRVVIYTPTIGPGVDFNPPSGPHFDYIFAYGWNKSNTARDFCQMLGRARKLKQQQVFVCFEVEESVTH
jgi:hypothetical protein